MLTFKRATEKDSTTIALLGRFTFSESHKAIVNNEIEFQNYLNNAFTTQKIKTELKQPNNFFWIAFYNHTPIGYAKLVTQSNSDFLAEKNACRLERIYILEDFFHLKAGKPLQELVFKKALELQYTWIWLTVSVKNFRAINFYIKNNYKSVGNIDFSIGNKTYDNTVFAKKLD